MLFRSGGGERLAVELARLREVRGPLLEVLGREEAAPLADRRGQDRRVDADEVALVEEVLDPLLDLVPHAKDGGLGRTAEPEVAMVQQVIDPVLLRLDRVVDGAGTDDL